MKNDEFTKVVHETIEIVKSILVKKQAEYTRGVDRLHNFKRASQLQNCIPERSLEGMMTKHIVSIYDFLDDLEKGVFPEMKKWDEKLIDAINYLILLRALLIERHHSATGEDIIK